MRLTTFLMCAAALLATPAFAQAPDGGTIFKQRCGACHSAVKGAPAGIAPNMAGIAGRKAASSAYANYSPALKASNLKWDAATLDKFLSGPTKLVPGTRMVISLSDPGQRAAVVAYLGTLKK